MIKSIKINYKLLAIILVIIFYLIYININNGYKANTISYATPFILIDAGHGSPDGGAIGLTTGVKESDLNLEYAKTLKTYFLSLNYKVELIRTSEYGLLEDKYEDMLKRKEIIEKSNCDIFISIHMNKFSLTSSIGAQTFYKQNDENSKKLANCIRDLLVKNIEDARKLSLEGDYLVLNSASCPACLVECGFLSNEKDELRLQQKEFREKLCYQIFCGTIKYLNSSLY
ncbi:MAG: N-acetylmuramoyl-L-alanine amidase [Clostridiales bacterium]|nr:N-acetylmuramoyl-L-alanine amidase [Clostridiales bacterium]